MSVAIIAPTPRLVSSWRRVFSDVDPFAWPFTQSIEEGRIFCPTDGYHLNRKQYSALEMAIKATGEQGFFISVTESKGQSFLSRPWGHWWCEIPSYDEYFGTGLALENALFSPDGHCGVLISHEMHAVVGGSAQFMRALSAGYDTWEEDIKALRAMWAANPNGEWVERLIPRLKSWELSKI